MSTRGRLGAAITGTLLLTLGSIAPAHAASDVGVGGYHDRIMRAAQDDLLRASELPEAGAGLTLGIDQSPRSALTAFTPRFGGLGLGPGGQAATVRGAPGDHGLAFAPDDPDQMQVGLSDRAELVGLAIDLSASAGMTNPQPGQGVGDSGFVVGGELAISGLRFDAAIGQDAALLGLDGSRMTAGVAYGFGRLDTRMSYSVVERESSVDTSLFTLGSQFRLRPGVVVQGDLAFTDDEKGDGTTAGLVSLRLNF